MTELMSPPTDFYLSYVPGRGYGSHQKIHSALGHAKNAVGRRPDYGGKRRHLYEEIDGIRTGRSINDHQVVGGQIWHWSIDHWELLFDIAPGAWRSEVPWAKTKPYYVP